MSRASHPAARLITPAAADIEVLARAEKFAPGQDYGRNASSSQRAQRELDLRTSRRRRSPFVNGSRSIALKVSRRRSRSFRMADTLGGGL